MIPLFRKRGPGLPTVSAITAVLVALTAGPATAEIIHRYDLNGSFADSEGGPALIPDGGVLVEGGGYSFGRNQGLRLIEPAMSPGHYTIGLSFSLDSANPTSRWHKIIDFNNRWSDSGLYVFLQGTLCFWAFGEHRGPIETIQDGMLANLLLTRDGTTREVKVLVNGVEQLSFIDSLDQGVLGPDNILTFFEDDIATGYQESGPGFVRSIRIYDGPFLPLISCAGFRPPLDAPPVQVRGNRALPLKARLFDGYGMELTDRELTAPPLLKVLFDPGDGSLTDVTPDALTVGLGSDGNRFMHRRGEAGWRLNLKTSRYRTPGTYTLFMASGDGLGYVINPTCVSSFVVR